MKNIFFALLLAGGTALAGCGGGTSDPVQISAKKVCTYLASDKSSSNDGVLDQGEYDTMLGMANKANDKKLGADLHKLVSLFGPYIGKKMTDDENVTVGLQALPVLANLQDDCQRHGVILDINDED